jgi:hypothetical protein
MKATPGPSFDKQGQSNNTVLFFSIIDMQRAGATA